MYGHTHIPVSYTHLDVYKRQLLNLDDVFDGENYAGTGTLRDDITDGILSSTKCAPYGDDEIYLACLLYTSTCAIGFADK